MLFDRVRKLNPAETRKGGRYVLYWAQMNRRVESNHALSFALNQADELNLPVLFYEGLTCSYPGTARRLQELGIGYVFHLRRRRADPNDALHRLAADAAALVTDDYPVFIARDHTRSVRTN